MNHEGVEPVRPERRKTARRMKLVLASVERKAGASNRPTDEKATDDKEVQNRLTAETRQQVASSDGRCCPSEEG
jgi:hypothetical protein